MVLHGIAWYCMVLYGIAWYCMVLHYLTLSCTILHSLALSCTLLHYLALSCTILHYLALFCTILHYLALSCTILLYPAHKVYLTCSQQMSRVIALDIAVVAQKVKVQYRGPKWSEKVCGGWISSRSGWQLELLTELIKYVLWEDLWEENLVHHLSRVVLWAKPLRHSCRGIHHNRRSPQVSNNFIK